MRGGGAPVARTGTAGWSLLRNRQFAVYWSSGLVSNTGTWLHNVTAGVVMLRLTGSAFMVGLVSVAIFLPVLLFGMSAGAVSDRFDRRLVVATSQGLASLAAVVLFALSLTGRVEPTSLLLSCFLIGTGYSVAKPALAAMLPALVPRGSFVDATAFNILQFNLGQILGPALSSLVLLTASPTWAFGVNALTFLVQVAAVRLLPVAAGGRTDGGAGNVPDEASSGVLEGLRFIRRTFPMAHLLLAVVLANASVEALRTLAPTIAQGLLDEDGAVAGLIVMGYSCGALAGLLAFATVRRRLRPTTMLAGSFVLQSAGTMGISLASSLPLVLVAAVPVGVGFSFAIPVLNAGLQTLTSDAFRGRVMASFSMAHLGCRPLFAITAGSVAALAGPRVTFGLFAAMACIGLLHGWRRRLGDATEGAD